MMAMNDTMMVITGQIALTQQSNSMVERFLPLDDDVESIWQPTTSDLVVFNCNIK